MSYFPKTKEGVEQVLEAVLDDRIVRAIEEWQGDELSYQDNLDMEKFEAEKERLAAFLAKRYETSAGPEVMDSRVATALRSYASGASIYFDEADLSSPQFTFVHMEQMTDLGYLVEDTAEEAEAQGWASEEMPAEFPTIRSYLEYQHKLLHQWMYHLSVCENCIGTRRPEPLFPPIDVERVMDEAGSQSRGDRQEFSGPPGMEAHLHVQEMGLISAGGFGGAYVGDSISEEEYFRLIEPSYDSVEKSIRIEDTEIGPSTIASEDLDHLPDSVVQFLTQPGSPVYQLLEGFGGEDIESYYLRIRLQPTPSASSPHDYACFASSGYDIGPQGLRELAEHFGESFADHIAEHVKPKFEARAGLKTVIIEVETEERITHVVLESGSGVA